MKRTNRVMSLLLAFIMVAALLPGTLTQVYAGYSDGDECWNCGHYHWGDFMHECGACSPDCTNDWCALETHCHRCGGCLNGDYPCDECGLCKDCMDEIGHCSQCDTCWMDYGGDDVLCGNCRRCEFCSTICPECGLCEDCANDGVDGMHCPECGNCYQVTEQCMFVENNHCKDCCEPCEQCGECIAGDHLDECPTCGLCVQCCEFNSMMAGCESGEVCVEDTEWDDHVCEGCGEFFENESDLCETCRDAGVIRCPGCCELVSECSEKMCEYDDEYEEHFCIDCGNCFHDVELCDTCAGAGEFRCADCCKNLAESMGCDGSCGEVWCSNDTYFEQHLDAEHGDHPGLDDHDPFPGNRWSYDKNGHWRDCRFCDEDENAEQWEAHRSSMAAHSYDKNNICTVCGYSAGNTLRVVKQPKTVRCVTGISTDYDEDPANGLLYFGNHPVTFSVTVKGGTGSYTYQWYLKYKDDPPTKLEDGMRSGQFSGTHTAILTVQVSPEACSENEDILYYCVITDGKTTVTTEKVCIRASHAYSSKYADNTVSAKPEDAAYKTVKLTYRNGKGEIVTVEAAASEGHRHQCLCDDGSLTRHYKTARPVMHTFGEAALLGRSAKKGAAEYDNVYMKTCTACGYKTYYESHKHVYGDRFDDSKRTTSAHASVCLVEGCDHIKMESHEWDHRHGGAGMDNESGGVFYRYCTICRYADYDYRPVDKDGNKIGWTTKNVLVTAINAQVSRTLAVEGDNLTLTINNNSVTQGKRCTGWTVTYALPDAENPATILKHDITFAYTIRQNKDGTWDTTIKLAGYRTGGYLVFTPTMVTCTDHEYIAEGYVAPVCMYDGFAGYLICKHCHAADPTDTRPDEKRVIPAAGTEHTGKKQPLYQKEVTLPSGSKTITWTTDKSESNGKRYNYKEGSCTEKGCDGNFLCSDCGRVIPGRSEYKHSHLVYKGYTAFSCFKNGYSGDQYCENCDKLVYKGYVITAPKKHETLLDVEGSAKAATCTVPGKEADQWCLVCEQVFGGKVIPAQGHIWVKDDANCTAVTIAYKCGRAGCTAAKFADVTPDAHSVRVVGGTALVGGKAVIKAAEGATVTLKLGTVPADKRFKEWEVVSGGVVIANAADPNGATFVMGSSDVEINAVLEDLSGHTHAFGDAWKSDDANHWKECECGERAEQASHTPSDWITDIVPTDTKDGAKHKECTVCRKVLETASIPAAGSGHTHAYDDTWRSDAENHWKECECGDKTGIAAHTFVWKTDREATKTETGIKHEECSVCGAKRSENTVIDKLPDGGSTGGTGEPESPPTGDGSHLIGWVALIFISGGVVLGTTAYGRKKKRFDAE